MPASALSALKWQPTGQPGNGRSNTVTDPIWTDLAIAFLAVMALLTVAVILDSVFRALQRHVQQNRAVRQWRRDVSAGQDHQYADDRARRARTGLL